MEIILAKTAGFCFGVNRAVNMVYDELTKNNNIYTYGPIVHNEQVVEELSQKGVSVLNDEDNLQSINGASVIIRAHGIPKKTYDLLLEAGVNIVDATCPFVKKIHRVVESASSQGSQVVVIGNKTHPEVLGIIGWCDINHPAIVIENKDEAEKIDLPSGTELTIVSQTTFHMGKFQELVEILSKKGYYTNVVNTICNATEERQKEAREITSGVDAMIVIGGSKSSNTQKLYEICSCECSHTQYIQTVDDLKLDSTESLSRVGITAGASTPKKLIEEVQNYVRINF